MSIYPSAFFLSAKVDARGCSWDNTVLVLIQWRRINLHTFLKYHNWPNGGFKLLKPWEERLLLLHCGSLEVWYVILLRTDPRKHLKTNEKFSHSFSWICSLNIELSGGQRPNETREMMIMLMPSSALLSVISFSSKQWACSVPVSGPVVALEVAERNI